MGPNWAIAVSALTFGSVHLIGGTTLGTLAVLPALFGIGAISGMLAVRSGELSQSILLHMGFNLLAVVARAPSRLGHRLQSPGPQMPTSEAAGNLFSGGMEWRHAQDVRKRRHDDPHAGRRDARSCSTAAPSVKRTPGRSRATS